MDNEAELPCFTMSLTEGGLEDGRWEFMPASYPRHLGPVDKLGYLDDFLVP